jgi:hypothetical protein
MRRGVGLCGLVGVWLCVGWLAGCGEDAGDDAATSGEGGKEDSGQGGLATLADRKDPVGIWFRDKSGVGEDGVVDTDYVRIVMGLLEQQGCAADTVNTFLISDSLLTGGEPFPRTVTTICSGDLNKASELFLSAPSGNDQGDIDIQTLEMFAWDPDARVYRFYRIDPTGEGSKVKLDANPTACAQCHLGPTSLDGAHTPMSPIMNELTRPWPHWSSEPDAQNRSFEVSDDIKGKQNYQSCVTPWLGSAPDLEQIIRAGFDKVNNARLRTRRDPAEVSKAMALLRPLFCAEDLNYATEDGGVLPASVLVDEGIANLYKGLNGGAWPWDWYSARIVRIGAPEGQPELDLIAVRGALDVGYEQRLVSLKILTSQQVLQVRAIDWKNPVFSEARCGLWKQANERYKLTPPSFSADYDTSKLLVQLLGEVMTVQGSGGQAVPLVAPGADQVVAVDLSGEGSWSEVADGLAAGSLPTTCDEDGGGACVLGYQAFGDAIDRYLKGIEADAGRRERLRGLRTERGCVAKAEYPSVPDLPGLEGACP